MKTKQFNLGSENGSVLMVTLVIGGIIGFSLASYLTLVNWQNRSTLRSTSWNSSLAMAESGVEEALTHLNYNCVTNPLSKRISNFKADGWVEVSSSPLIYERRRWLGKEGWYTVHLLPTGPNKVNIEAYGGSAVPDALAQGQSPFLVAATTTSSSGYAVRKVAVTARARSLFSKGMVAKGQIDMSGNDIRVDSFDSRSTNFSSGGIYDPGKAKDGGSVASNSGLINSLNVGNANIYGTTATGPGGSVSIGNNGHIGSFDYEATNSTSQKIQSGYFTDDMNMEFPDVEAPFTIGNKSPLYSVPYTITNVGLVTVKQGNKLYTEYQTNVTTTVYDKVFESGDYKLDIGFEGKILVTGNARVYVTHDISLSGSEGIWIAPGASLQLYMSGSDAQITGNGVVNQGGNAGNFGFYGLPSNKSIKVSGNSGFLGTIYSPSAELQLAGGGNDSIDFQGASISGSVKMNGHFNFHYDEALGDIGPSRGYVIEKWTELTPPSGNAILSYLPK